MKEQPEGEIQWEPEQVLRRLARLLGGVVLASLFIEAAVRVVVGDPRQPSFSGPGARFLMLTAPIPWLGRLTAGLGLIVAGNWEGKTSVQKRMGLSFLIGGGLALLALIWLLVDYHSLNMELPPAGLVRLRIQLVRAIVFYTTVGGIFWIWGRSLLARSERTEEVIVPS